MMKSRPRHRYSRLLTASFVTVAFLFVGLAQSDESASDAAREAWTSIQAGALLIDVRSAREFEDGHIEGAVNVPHDQVDALVQAVGPDLDREVVVYCGTGRRAGLAQQALNERGYTDVHNAMGYQDLLDTHP